MTLRHWTDIGSMHIYTISASNQSVIMPKHHVSAAPGFGLIVMLVLF